MNVPLHGKDEAYTLLYKDRQASPPNPKLAHCFASLSGVVLAKLDSRRLPPGDSGERVQGGAE
jgi:hypothetical protein